MKQGEADNRVRDCVKILFVYKKIAAKARPAAAGLGQRPADEQNKLTAIVLKQLGITICHLVTSIIFTGYDN